MSCRTVETDTQDAGRVQDKRQTAYYKIGGKLLYKEKDILALLERNRVEAFDDR